MLHALDEQDDCTVNSLIERTHLPNGTLTGLLDSLERDHCIQRARNPDDGRSWCIRLTAKGRRLCLRLHQRHHLVMAMFRDALSEKETAELKRLLARATACMHGSTTDEDLRPARPSMRGAPSRTAAKPPRRRRRMADAQA